MLDSNLRDDLYQAGFFGLMKAAERFDGSRGIKFKTYAWLRILGEVKDYIRDQWGARSDDRRKLQQSVHLSTLTQDNGDEKDHEDLRPPIHLKVEEYRKALMNKLKTRLNSRDLVVYLTYFVDRLTMRKIGEEMELTEARVCQILAKIPREEMQEIIEGIL